MPHSDTHPKGESLINRQKRLVSPQNPLSTAKHYKSQKGLDTTARMLVLKTTKSPMMRFFKSTSSTKKQQQKEPPSDGEEADADDNTGGALLPKSKTMEKAHRSEVLSTSNRTDTTAPATCEDEQELSDSSAAPPLSYSPVFMVVSARTSSSINKNTAVCSSSSTLGLDDKSTSNSTTIAASANATMKNLVSRRTTKVNRYGHKEVVQASSSPQEENASSATMYGYGDAAPGAKPSADANIYGYEDNAGAPHQPVVVQEVNNDRWHPTSRTRRCGNDDTTPPASRREGTESVSNYCGYGDTVPDSKSTDKYGYENVNPDSDSSKYGYGDAVPDDRSKYGYGGDEVNPEIAHTRPGQQSSHVRTPRRSSMKQTGSPARRASIQTSTQEEVFEVNIPDGSNRGKKVQRRSSITFKDTAKVRRVVPVKHLAEKPEKLWFQEDEYQAIRKKACAIVHRVESGGDLGGKKLCTRGLEKYMGSTRETIAGHKNQAWDSVLDEQCLQRERGEFNEEHIANVYKYTTMHKQHEANERAAQDAVEAEVYLRKMRRAYRRMSM